MNEYDDIANRYRGLVPLSVVKGFIERESNWQPAATNPKVSAPGGGPKTGLLQPPQTGLRAWKKHFPARAARLDLANPVDNLQVGLWLLNQYLGHLRQDFPRGFTKPLEQDANAVAVLAHAYNHGYTPTAALLRRAGTTRYRDLEKKFPFDALISRGFSDKVLRAAQKHGYPAVLPKPGGLAPIPATVIPPPKAAEAGMSNLTLLLGAAAMAGGAWYLKRKR